MSDEAVLVVNTGSHSVQVLVIEPDDTVRDGIDIEEQPDSPSAHAAFESFLTRAGNFGAVGHRIVHGGHELTRHRVVDDAVRASLADAVSLDRMHMEPALAYLDRCRELLPETTHVACLDTAFHAEIPEVARTYPLPRKWREEYGVRRFGFHGLSHAYAVSKAAELLNVPLEESSFISVHLGGGSSACTVRDGRSVWSSMGFTPLEGMMMGTRSGSVDPGILLWLQCEAGLTAQEVSQGLQHHSGLLGLSDGLSEDTRVLVDASREGNAAAELALDVFALRARQEIAAAAVSLGRIDGLIFTGEIGADQPEVRRAVTARLRVLGIAPVIDPTQDGDRIISLDGSGVPVLLVHPREDLQIAREVRTLCDAGDGQS